MATLSEVKEYIGGAKEELEKVIFPNKTELRQGFLAVISVVTVITLFLALVNLIMGQLVGVIL